MRKFYEVHVPAIVESRHLLIDLCMEAWGIQFSNSQVPIILVYGFQIGGF
jgi:hypothetical protein